MSDQTTSDSKLQRELRKVRKDIAKLQTRRSELEDELARRSHAARADAEIAGLSPAAKEKLGIE